MGRTAPDRLWRAHSRSRHGQATSRRRRTGRAASSLAHDEIDLIAPAASLCSIPARSCVTSRGNWLPSRPSPISWRKSVYVLRWRARFLFAAPPCSGCADGSRSIAAQPAEVKRADSVGADLAGAGLPAPACVGPGRASLGRQCAAATSGSAAIADPPSSRALCARREAGRLPTRGQPAQVSHARRLADGGRHRDRPARRWRHDRAA